MNRNLKAATLVGVAALVTAAGSIFGPAQPVKAVATTKTLDTNFTLVNLGSSATTATISYQRSQNSASGAAWPATTTSATLNANGGQAIIRQYNDASLANGAGSAIVSAGQSIGSVVQILARTPAQGGTNERDTSGAYTGVGQTSQTWGVPLVLKNVTGATGTSNSVLAVQNTGSASTTVSIVIQTTTGGTQYTRPQQVAAGATYFYDLSDEAASNVPDGFVGSATVTGGGQNIAVVVMQFTGADALQTFNAFRQEDVGTSWVAPLVMARVPATGGTQLLSTPVTFQNRSGAAANVTLNCTPDAASPNQTSPSIGPISVGNGGTAIFNPVTDTTNFPTGWFGSCRVTSTGAGVGFVQIRDTITGTAPNAAAYEMIRTTGTDRTVFVPLYMRALQTNQGTLGTAVTIQNLSATAANVTWNYIPSSGAPVSCNQTIPGNSSLIHNQVTGANVCSDVATNAFGSIRITSDQPIDGFVQIRNTTQPNGDTFMAHNVFTTP